MQLVHVLILMMGLNCLYFKDTAESLTSYCKDLIEAKYIKSNVVPSVFKKLYKHSCRTSLNLKYLPFFQNTGLTLKGWPM